MLNKKIIVIVGPNASGKTDLSLKIAKKFNGEIISADSRQIYKGMDIGTGKITEREKQGIPHYLLDIVSPKTRFNVVKYRKFALRAIEKIQKKNKLPILVGGTGFYIQTVLEGTILPPVKPDWKLRRKLEQKTNQELFKMLKNLDPDRAQTIDKNNPRRLIRALEIVKKLGTVPVPSLPCPRFEVLMIGVKRNQKELKERIKKRLLKRLKAGMIAEVKKINQQGVSWKRLEEFGLEYRYVALFLQGKLTKQEMIEKLQKEIEHYAKRQITWFKKDKRIHWISNYNQAKNLLKHFL